MLLHTAMGGDHNSGSHPLKPHYPNRPASTEAFTGDAD